AAAIDAALEPTVDKRKITCSQIETWLEKITKVDVGREELREKILMLRGTRTPIGEAAPESTLVVRSTGKGARRRLWIRGLHPTQGPSGSAVRAPAPSYSQISSPPSSRSPDSMRGGPDSMRGGPDSMRGSASQAPPHELGVDLGSPRVPKFSDPP